MSGYWLRCTIAVMGSISLGGCDAELGRTGGPVGNGAKTAADTAANLDSPANPPTSPPPAQPADANAATPPAPGTPAPMQTPPASESNSHVGKRTNDILNAKELAGDPNWKVVADDPAKLTASTVPGTAYNRAAALSGSVGVEQWLKMEHASSGQYPTYQQLIDYIGQNSFDMPALQVYRHYGYDESTGQIVVLENQEEKAKRHGELGIQ